MPDPTLLFSFVRLSSLSLETHIAGSSTTPKLQRRREYGARHMGRYRVVVFARGR